MAIFRQTRPTEIDLAHGDLRSFYHPHPTKADMIIVQIREFQLKLTDTEFNFMIQEVARAKSNRRAG